MKRAMITRLMDCMDYSEVDNSEVDIHKNLPGAIFRGLILSILNLYARGAIQQAKS